MGKNYDNVVIHAWPDSPYIVKASASFRTGKKIGWQIAMKDVNAVIAYLDRQFPGMPYRVITHKGW